MKLSRNDMLLRYFLDKEISILGPVIANVTHIVPVSFGSGVWQFPPFKEEITTAIIPPRNDK